MKMCTKIKIKTTLFRPCSCRDMQLLLKSHQPHREVKGHRWNKTNLYDSLLSKTIILVLVKNSKVQTLRLMAKKFLQFISLLAKLKTPFHSLELQTLTKVWFQQQPSQTIQKNSISKEKLYLNKTKVSLLLKTNPCSSKQPTLKK